MTDDRFEKELNRVLSGYEPEGSGLSKEEAQGLRALSRLLDEPRDSLSPRARQRILARVRREIGLRAPVSFARRLAASFAALMFAATGLAYASLDAPPDSVLFPFRDTVETMAVALTPSYDSKAARVLEQAERYASYVLATPKSREATAERAARIRAYRTLKARLAEYRHVKKQVRMTQELSKQEQRAIRAYLKAKARIAPDEPTITLEPRLRELKPRQKPSAPAIGKRDSGSKRKSNEQRKTEGGYGKERGSGRRER